MVPRSATAPRTPEGFYGIGSRHGEVSGGRARRSEGGNRGHPSIENAEKVVLMNSDPALIRTRPDLARVFHLDWRAMDSSMFNRLASGMIATTTSSISLLPPDVASRRSQSIGLVSKGWPGGAGQRWDVAVERGSLSAGNVREIDDEQDTS